MFYYTLLTPYYYIFFLNYKELLLLMQFNLKKFLDYSRNLEIEYLIFKD